MATFKNLKNQKTPTSKSPAHSPLPQLPQLKDEVDFKGLEAYRGFPEKSSFQRVCFLKLNDPLTHRALWLRFSLLSSRNGFNRIAETWAIFFEKSSEKDVKKIAVKQTHEIESFSFVKNAEIRIGNCELSLNKTHGKVQAKGDTIEWDLSFHPGTQNSFDATPRFFARTKLLGGSVGTVHEELYFTGTTRINGETLHWKNAPGMQGVIEGSKSGHSWTWGHCNTFTDTEGKPVSFLFEGLSVKARLGPLTSPRLNTFFFVYLGEKYTFNSLKDLFHIRSKHRLNEWEFQVDRGELSFRGMISAEHKDFVGLTYEDTNGSLLYCANSKLASMKVFIYRRGKLECTMTADGSAAFEVVSRDKNPYVQLII